MSIESNLISNKRKILSAGPSITKVEVDLVTEAVAEGWFEKRNMHLDPLIKEFSEYTGIKHCLPVSHCTDALHLAMLGLGIGPGDEVIVPDITWVASTAPLVYVGATPIFADIDKDSWCLSPSSFEQSITEKTKAVVVVDTYGNMPDMDAILGIAKKHDIKVIEDAAESMGASYKGKKAGSFGDIGCFSFNATKIMVAGQGGMVATNNEELFKRFEILHHHGMLPYSEKAFWSVEVGHNYQWPNILAALALGQLRRLDELIDIKRNIFSWYKERLGNIDGIQLNQEAEGTKSTFWIINAILGGPFKIEKEIVGREFKKYGIDTRPFFYPVSSQPAYDNYTRAINYAERNPVAYEVSKYGISLPYAMTLTREDVNYVCDVFLEILDKKRRS